MEKQIGLWIDHKKAVIVKIKGKQEEVLQIESKVEKRMRAKGGGVRGRAAHTALFVAEEPQNDRRYQEHLNKYYQQVISVVGEADSLLVLGAGEAKHEFEKRIAHNGNHVKEIHVETADKMTERQIAAKVRNYFKKRADRS